MIDSSPQSLLFTVLGAFVGGWLVAKLGGYFARRLSRQERDPREDRIRSLEAELRVAHSGIAKRDETLAAREQELTSTKATVAKHEKSISDHLAEIERLRIDLRDSVKKTHELRDELTDRAEENLRSTVKLHQVETELLVVRETSDLMSTGDLSFDVSEDPESPQENVVKLKS